MIAIAHGALAALKIGDKAVDFAMAGDKLVYPHVLVRCAGQATTYAPAAGGYMQVALSASNSARYADANAQALGLACSASGSWTYFGANSTMEGYLHYRGDIRLVPAGLSGNVTMGWGNLGGSTANPEFFMCEDFQVVLACDSEWHTYHWEIPVRITAGGMWALGIQSWAGHLEERNVAVTFRAV